MRKLLVIPVLAIFLMAMVAPFASDVDADSGNIYIHDIEEVSINAGSSKTIQIVIFDKCDEGYMFQIKDHSTEGITVSTSYSDSPVVEAKNTKTLTATIDVSKYTRKGTYECDIEISFVNLSGSDSFTITKAVPVSVSSIYSEDAYNKILGMFAIPGIDSPELNALITLGIWFLITLLVIAIYNLIIRIVFRDEESRKLAKDKIGWAWLLIIMVYGVYNTLIVYGVNDKIVDLYWAVMQFVYILFFAFVAWNIYKAIVYRLFHKMEEKGEMEGMDTSLIPLFNTIGKVVIAVVSAAAFLVLIGVNVAGIITGAGIVGLAVSLGAQNLLTELFGGISLAITRPFIKEDMVRIGDSDDVYEVVEIGLINTEFKEWGNTTHIIMPNSVVSKSKITNCTEIPDAYRVFLYFEVGYEADMELTKKLLLEVANEHPHVIKDGSYTQPQIRLESFNDYDITFRVAAYVDDFDNSSNYLAEMREAAIKKMDANNIDIPYSQYEVFKK